MENLKAPNDESKGSFLKIEYSNLNSRQKENYNFQKVSAVLAGYGYITIRLSDDWQGADFIAYHIDGVQFLRVQLKGRMVLDTKYTGKDIWICFDYGGDWFLYPHDKFLVWALKFLNVGATKNWVLAEKLEDVEGKYSWPKPSKKVLLWLNENGFNLGCECKKVE